MTPRTVKTVYLLLNKKLPCIDHYIGGSPVKEAENALAGLRKQLKFAISLVEAATTPNDQMVAAGYEIAKRTPGNPPAIYRAMMRAAVKGERAWARLLNPPPRKPRPLTEAQLTKIADEAEISLKAEAAAEAAATLKKNELWKRERDQMNDCLKREWDRREAERLAEWQARKLAQKA